MKDRCDFSSQSVKKSHLDTYSYPFQAVKIGLLPNFVQPDLIPMYFFLKAISYNDALLRANLIDLKWLIRSSMCDVFIRELEEKET